MKYVAVSSSEIRARGIYNLVKEFLSDFDGIYLVGKYDMDYLLGEDLDFLFFDVSYLKKYKSKISKSNKIVARNLILVSLEEEESIEYYSHIKVINGKTTIEELEEMLDVKIQKETNFNLTERDKSILYLLSQGMSNKEIGKKLYLSEKTVKNNLTRIYKNLGVVNKYQAINLTRNLTSENNGPI